MVMVGGSGKALQTPPLLEPVPPLELLELLELLEPEPPPELLDPVPPLELLELLELEPPELPPPPPQALSVKASARANVGNSFATPWQTKSGPLWLNSANRRTINIMEVHHFSSWPLQRFLSKQLKRLIFLAAGVTWLAAAAHVMPAGHGSLNLKGSQVYLLLAVPLSAVPEVDRNADGTIDAQELNDSAQALVDRIQKGLAILATHNGVAQERMQWQHAVLSLPREAGESELNAARPAAYLHFMGSGQFQGVPQGLQVRSDLWSAGADAALKLTVTRSTPGAAEEQEVGLLTASHPQFNFFAPRFELAQRFAQHGLEHILGGADHLVFLVVLLASGVRWRRWLLLLTGFTIAHGVTFGLAAVGWVHAPSQWVESLIAASIVLVAALHLARIEMALRWELMLVFALGLIHGLGFAAALQADSGGALAGLARYPLLCILSFNVGVEAGQVLVAGALILFVTVIRRVFKLTSDVVWQRSAAWCGLVVGSYWLWERWMGL